MINSNALLLKSVLLLATVTCISQAQSTTTTPRPAFPPNWLQYFPWYRPGQQPQKYTPPTTPRNPPPPPRYLPPPPPPPPPPVPNYSDFMRNPATLSQPGYGDYWYGWTNLGGAFRGNPTVANSGVSNTMDVILAINRRGQIRVKIIQGTTVSKWVGIGDSALPSTPTPGIYPQGDLSAVLVGNQLYVYASGYNNKIYEGVVTINSPPTTQTIAFSAVNNGDFLGTPAFVYASNERMMFAVSIQGDLYMLKTTVGVWGFTPMLPGGLNFLPSAAAAVYNSISSGPRVVVAAVAGNGDLYYHDNIFSGYTATTTFVSLEVKCIERPIAVSTGNSVEIYCRTGDLKFICITVSNGSDPDYRELLNESLPRYFFGSNLNNVVYFTSKSSDGRIMRKIHSS